jgi:hypothetical protein
MDQYVTLPQVTQQFPQVRDTVGNLIGPITACGARQYQFDYTPTFLKVSLASDVLQQNSLSVLSVDESDVGDYPITMRVSLVSFPNVNESVVSFTIHIHSSTEQVNRMPILESDLPNELYIQMLFPWEDKTSWIYELPSIFDPEGDPVTISCYIYGKASSFVKFENRTLTIDDIRDFNSTSMAPDSYLIFFTIDDGTNVQT